MRPPLSTLDLCIPTFDEAAVIAPAIAATREAVASLPGVRTRILVADCPGTGATAEAVRRLGLDDVVLLPIAARGKGRALIEAARFSDADYFALMDVDLAAHPNQFPALFEALTQGAQLAVGSRLASSSQASRSLYRSLPSASFNALRRFILPTHILDSQCPLKLATAAAREHLRACQEEGWFFDVEWIARVERAGFPVAEIPIVWDESLFPERAGKVRVIGAAVEGLAALGRIRRSLGARAR